MVRRLRLIDEDGYKIFNDWEMDDLKATVGRYKVSFTAMAPRSNARDPEPVTGAETIEANGPGEAMQIILQRLKKHGFYDCRVTSQRKQKIAS